MWGKILSRIFIDSNFNNIDSEYELVYHLFLLQDFIKLLISFEFLNNRIEQKEAIALLVNHGFYKEYQAKQIWQKIKNSKRLDIDNYYGYKIINELYESKCANNRMSYVKFLERLNDLERSILRLERLENKEQMDYSGAFESDIDYG